MLITTDLPVTIKSGKYETIFSTIVHTAETEIEISIIGLKFEFNFLTDDKGVRYDGEIKDDRLVIKLYNHNHSLGEGLLTPAHIANLDVGKLFFTYFVYRPTLKTNERKIEITFLKGD